jgi:hypothetical protein
METTIYNFYIGLPNFLSMQISLIRKFIPTAKQIVIINCGDKNDENALISVCEEAAAPYVVKEGHYKVGQIGCIGSARAHATVISDVWQDILASKNRGIVVLMDCDIMPIKSFDFAKALGDSPIFYRPDVNKFLALSAWRNFLIFNLDKILDPEMFNFGRYTTLNEWLIKHPDEHKTFQFTHFTIEGHDFELYLDAFLHFINCTGYGGLTNDWKHNPEREKVFLDYLESCLATS